MLTGVIQTTNSREKFVDFLYAHIPLCRAMQLEVDELSTQSVKLSAPLSPNINPHGTAFGGSLASLLTLAAWSLLYMRLDALDIGFDIVVHKSEFNYLRPVTGRLQACCDFTEQRLWERFERTLRQRRRARLCLNSSICSQQLPGAEMNGQFVAHLKA